MNLNSVVDVHRPGMRRKSSAQNLLSSFKSSAAQIHNANSATSPPNIPPATPTAMFGPTTQVSQNKEWDSQSVISDPLPPPPMVQGQFVNAVDYIRDLVQKRIVTMTYLRNVHEGCASSLPLFCTGEVDLGFRRSHWFHTVVMTRADIERLFPNHAMRKRCVPSIVHSQCLPDFRVEHTDSPCWGCPCQACLKSRTLLTC
jgi:hypothetical protein